VGLPIEERFGETIILNVADYVRFQKFGCGGLCEVLQMLDAGDYVRFHKCWMRGIM
jgi:hypothetical protein